MMEHTNVQPQPDPEPFTCSGIVVVARPDRLQEVRSAIEAMDGFRVHQVHELSARLVVTQEASTDAQQAEGLLRLQRLPGVLAADLVYYHRENPGTDTPVSGEELGAQR